jgi:hypothetical protein
VTAYTRHPDTFFGTYSPASRQAKDPLDLYDFFYDSYSKSSRRHLLELTMDYPDIDSLSGRSQEELAVIYCERMADAAARQAGSRMASA